MRGTAQPDGRLGGSERWSYFLPFMYHVRDCKYTELSLPVWECP